MRLIRSLNIIWNRIFPSIVIFVKNKKKTHPKTTHKKQSNKHKNNNHQEKYFLLKDCNVRLCRETMCVILLHKKKKENNSSLPGCVKVTRRNARTLAVLHVLAMSIIHTNALQRKVVIDNGC